MADHKRKSSQVTENAERLVRERNEYIEALVKKHDEELNCPTDFVPVGIVQAMINEQRLRIDELSREIAQLKDDLMDKEQIIAGLTTSAPADSNSAVPSGTTAAKTEDYWRKYFDVDKKHGDIDQFLSFSDDSPKSPEPWCGSLAGTPPKTAKPGAPRG